MIGYPKGIEALNSCITFMIDMYDKYEYIQTMKSKIIQFRVDPEQEEQLRLRALSAEMTVSDYIRYLVDLDINKPQLLDDLLRSAENLHTLAKNLSVNSK